jgi:hypothetical protein
MRLAWTSPRIRETHASGLATQTSDADLMRRFRHLANEIQAFLDHQQRSAPRLQSPWYALPDDATDAQRAEVFQEYSRAVRDHSAETVTHYRTKFAARTLAVANDAGRLGLLSPTDRAVFDVPSSSLAIRRVTAALYRLSAG